MRLALAEMAIASALTGCMMPQQPGQLVGTYHVSAELSDNSCGQDALPAAQHLSFDVDIRRDKGGSGYWLRGAPPARPGELDADGSFSFELQSTYTVGGMMMTKDPAETLIEMDPVKLANPDLVDQLDQAPTAPCQLSVSETVHGMLHRMLAAQDGGSAGSSGSDDLVAAEDISMRGVSGTSCMIVLASQGGPFEALPCKAHYDLTGSLK